MVMRDFTDSIERLEHFEQRDLKKRLAKLEAEVKNMNQKSVKSLASSNMVDDSLLRIAFNLKEAVGQINVDIHAIGIMLLLPQILQRGEIIESLSLGAGNTGKKFDLETNMSIAEFKFIHWKGGSESIRQNSLFKDFFYLAEEKTNKKRYLYVLGSKYPDKFFTGSRSISSVWSKDVSLGNEFRKHYKDRFTLVSEYYGYRKHIVNIEDIYQIMPSLDIHE